MKILKGGHVSTNFWKFFFGKNAYLGNKEEFDKVEKFGKKMKINVCIYSEIITHCSEEKPCRT